MREVAVAIIYKDEKVLIAKRAEGRSLAENLPYIRRDCLKKNLN